MPTAAVVGKGLFGAAAARHLARAGWATVAIGPDEPPDPVSHCGPFGAHYDEARILVARGDPAEVALTELTVEGMAALEKEEGGELIARSGTIEVSRGGSAVARTILDGLINVAGDASFVEEPPPQGYFNPRSYIAAALNSAVANGARVHPSVVTGIERWGARFVISTTAGEVEADRVVVAAGAWSNRLLPRPVALRFKTETVILAELHAAIAAQVTMRPTVVHGLTRRVEDVYTLPPLEYPDGKWYLKLGANTLHDRSVDAAGIDDWYRFGEPAAAGDLEEAFRTVFPDLPVAGFHTERCVITYTPHGRPYIGALDPPGMFIAAAGNGHGASWADGVGRLVAGLVTKTAWPDRSAVQPEAFEVLYADAAHHWSRPLLLRDRI